MSADNSESVRSDTTIIVIMGFLCGSQQIVITHVLEAARFLTSKTSIASVWCKRQSVSVAVAVAVFLGFLFKVVLSTEQK